GEALEQAYVPFQPGFTGLMAVVNYVLSAIPSELEGSRHETFKVTPRDPPTIARDDGYLESYFTRTFLRRKVGTSRSWPSTIVGSLFSKRPRVMGSNCKISCFAAAAAFSRFGFSASTFGAING